MSLRLFAENNDGDIVEYTNRLRSDTLEVVQMAAECAVGSSLIVIDNPDGDFYIRGLKPLYLIETDAEDDDYFGLVGLFYTGDRTWRRGNARTEAGSEVHIQIMDVNTLLTRRVQKGTDAKREQETDVERIVDWVSNTAEFVGGTGDAGFSVENRDYMFTDSPYQMSETDYTSQDSAGVVNDALQDSGKNAFLFPSPSDTEYIRIGMWYGRTERTDFSSIHKISNYLSDISPETMDPEWMFDPDATPADPFVWAPSMDAELERTPDRVASGVMVMADGSYAYVTSPTTREAFAARDMVMQAELVKTQAQATRRATRYLRDLRNEDDAISVAVLVPNMFVNGFVQGMRVQYRSSWQPGYSTGYVWMRIASRTVRQVSSGSGLYEIALDLRAEEPPDSATTGNGATACTGLTPADTYLPLGGSGSTSGPSDGVVYYLRPGQPWPIIPTVGYVGSWHFPVFGGGGTTDYAGDCSQNRARLMVVGDGTMTIHTAEYLGNPREMAALLYHHQYGSGSEGDTSSGVDVLDSLTPFSAGDEVTIEVSTHDSVNCTHWVDITDMATPPVCGSKWGFVDMEWDPA